MFWFIPQWTLQSLKLLTETVFYLFGMGEDSKTTALFKSVFSGPFSIWIPYKILSYIPSISSLFGFYNTVFGFLFVPIGLLWGSSTGGDDALKTFRTDFKACMDGSSAYFRYNDSAGNPQKGEVTLMS
jgi:hypothetical protein